MDVHFCGEADICERRKRFGLMQMTGADRCRRC